MEAGWVIQKDWLEHSSGRKISEAVVNNTPNSSLNIGNTWWGHISNICYCGGPGYPPSVLNLGQEMWTGRKGDNLMVWGEGGISWDRQNKDGTGVVLTLNPEEVKWKSFSHVWLFATPWTIEYMEFSRPEYWSDPFSRGSFQPRDLLPRDQTQVFHIAGDSLPVEPQGKPKNTGVGSLSLLQRIFPTQESNQGLLHCRWILYQLSYQESHKLLSYYLKKGEAMIDTSNT